MRAKVSPAAAMIPTTNGETVQEILDRMAIPHVKHLIDVDVIVPTGVTCFHSKTEIEAGVTLEILGTAEFMVLS